MPNITSDTPTKNGIISKVAVIFPMPFAEGHEVSAGEAAALNQVLIENVRNNLAKTVKGMVEADTDPELIQAKVDEYAANYEFGVRSVSSRVSYTPLEKLCQSMAKEQLRKGLAGKGFTVKAFKESKGETGDQDYQDLIDKLAARPDLIALAEQRLAIENEAAKALGDLDLD